MTDNIIIYGDGTESPSSNKRTEAIAKLPIVTTGSLLRLLKIGVGRLSVDAVLPIAQELTNRGIAPTFRKLDTSDPWFEGNTEADFLFLLCDLQWIAAHHPDHQTRNTRWKGIFKPDQLVKTAEYAHWGGNRSFSAIASGLDLSVDQQRECFRIRFKTVATKLGGWEAREQKACCMIASHVLNDNHDRRTMEQKQATIALRQSLWLPAHMGSWQPKRVAELMGMKTGEPAPANFRSIIHRHLQQLPQADQIEL